MHFVDAKGLLTGSVVCELFANDAFSVDRRIKARHNESTGILCDDEQPKGGYGEEEKMLPIIRTLKSLVNTVTLSRFGRNAADVLSISRTLV